jgi:radical SAM superfamily enzyme YgiQ (UPF0313 family)
MLLDPFIPKLDDLPLPLHELLPLQKYRMPLIKGPFTFIVTSRGCPAACTYCIKHVSYQFSARVRFVTNDSCNWGSRTIFPKSRAFKDSQSKR